MLRFKEGWTGKTIDPNDAVRADAQISLRWFGSERVSHARDCVQRQQAWLMRELTRMHELFYGRNSTPHFWRIWASSGDLRSARAARLLHLQLLPLPRDDLPALRLVRQVDVAVLRLPLLRPDRCLPRGLCQGDLCLASSVRWLSPLRLVNKPLRNQSCELSDFLTRRLCSLHSARSWRRTSTRRWG